MYAANRAGRAGTCTMACIWRGRMKTHPSLSQLHTHTLEPIVRSHVSAVSLLSSQLQSRLTSHASAHAGPSSALHAPRRVPLPSQKLVQVPRFDANLRSSYHDRRRELQLRLVYE